MQLTVPRSATMRRYVAPVGLLLAAVLALGACSSQGASICNASCDCQGCSTTALQTCVQTADDNVKEAGDVGCGSEMSTYLSCIESRGQCIGAKYSSGGCDVEFTKISNCLISAKCTIDASLAIHC